MIEVLKPQRCRNIHVIESSDQVLTSSYNGNEEYNVPCNTVQANANTVGILQGRPHRPSGRDQWTSPGMNVGSGVLIGEVGQCNFMRVEEPGVITSGPERC
jgi:hypothetical protein